MVNDISITPYDKVPSAIDMSPYVAFYRGIVQDVLSAKNGKDDQCVSVVDIGVRYGCSSRIFRDALMNSRDNWKLTLIDPVVTPQAEELTQDEHVTFLKQTGVEAAQSFKDNSVDIVHIDTDYDGSHPYELSFESLLAFWNKLRSDGRLVIHDCTDHFPSIVRLVNELKASGWKAVHCEPRPECPIAAPVVLKRKKIETNSMPPLTAVIPVVQEKWLGPLLNGMAKMKTQPEEVIIIDNANGVVSSMVSRYEKKLNIRYLVQPKNIGVNASWNLGLAEAKTSWITFLNDDVVLPSRFFAVIQAAILNFPRAGFIVPSTLVPDTVGKRFPTWEIGRPNDVKAGTAKPAAVNVPVRDGGWAMTLRKDLLEPIPNELHTFCGDDFWFRRIIEQGYWALRLLNTSVFHYVGISLDKPMRVKLALPSLEQDQTNFRKILERKKT